MILLRFGANLETKEANDVWKFIIYTNKGKLLKKNFEPMKKVVEFIEKIVNLESNDWVLASYKDMVALKNPMDRTTTIYTKLYFNARTNGAFDGCKTINL